MVRRPDDKAETQTSYGLNESRPVHLGLDLLTEMRVKGRGSPFIFITAYPDENLRTRAMKAGAVCFLAKPFAVHRLIECLEAALEAGRSEAGT